MKNAFVLSLIVLTVLTCGKVSGQSDVLKTYQTLPIMSPEAASLAKFVEVPVSNFNGVPDISIPLYEVVEGDIKVPIILRYHAGGIKVNEEASWVGLGWSLECGGTISREINGLDDFEYLGYTNAGVPLPAPNNGTTFDNAFYFRASLQGGFGSCPYFSENGSTYNYTAGTAASIDGEPDIFMYTFGGYSGKYIFKSATEGYSLNRENVKLAYAVNAMTAIAPDGFEYNFDRNEQSTVLRMTGSGASAMEEYSAPVNTAYNLTRIKSPLGKDVFFHYPSLPPFGNIGTIPSNLGVRTMRFSYEHTIRQVMPSGPPPQQWIASYSESYGALLDSIVFSHGTIKFIKSHRQDLQNAWKLDRIEILNRNRVLVKTYVFNYDYFQGSAQFGDEHNKHSGINLSIFTENFRKLRLRLLSLHEIATDGKKIAHQFAYNTETPLPYKTSFAVDYWGFFNGIQNNHTLLPSGQSLQKYYGVPDELRWYEGAVRDPDSVSMQAGVLTGIKYPTGGTVKFRYEANKFTNTINGNVVKTASVVDFNPAPGAPSASYNNPVSGEFTINAQSVNISYILNYKNPINPATCYQGPSQDNCMWVSIERRDGNDWITHQSWYLQGPSSTVMVQAMQLALPSGTYRLKAHYPEGDNGDLYAGTMPYYATMNVSYSVFASSTVTLPGGGLRIRKIEYTDPITEKSWVREYSYSNGVNLNLPVMTYASSENFPDVDCGTFETQGCCPSDGCTAIIINKMVSLYSDNIVRYTNSANGSFVGYSGVTVELEGKHSGKSVYVYNVRPSISTPDDVLPGVPTANILDNGLLLKQSEFKYEDSAYVKIREFENEYDLYNKKLLWGFKTEKRIPLLSCSNGISTFACASCEQIVLHFYPVRLAHIRVKKSYERTLVGNDVQEIVTSYQYNTEGYVFSEQVTDSDGKVLVTEYKYPMDYAAGAADWLLRLQQKNMINSPVEILKKVNGNVFEGSFLKFKNANNLTTPNEVYGVETIAPKVIASSAPGGVLPGDFKLKGRTEYDASGNVILSQAADNIITSYAWAYNQTVPVAVVQNALPTQIYHTSFEEAITNATPVSRTGSQGYHASFTVPLPPAGGTYSLVYWKKVGSGAWEIVRTTMSADTDIGGEGIVIDEVRVFPPGSSMVTYTYDLLRGMTSKTDANNLTTFYEYDTFGRLRLIKDDAQNIIRMYDYNYMVR